MRLLLASLFAGAALVAGALAQSSHVLTVQLPGGTVEKIRYSGDTPPQVFLDPDSGPADWFGPNSPFAAFDRMSEELDQRAARLFEQAAGMAGNEPSDQDQLIEAYSGGLPVEAQSYSIVSTFTSNGACGRSVEIASRGDGQRRVVAHSFGDCGPRATVAVPYRSKRRSDTITARAEPAHKGELKEAALRY